MRLYDPDFKTFDIRTKGTNTGSLRDFSFYLLHSSLRGGKYKRRKKESKKDDKCSRIEFSLLPEVRGRGKRSGLKSE